jgi:hypothetical protein
MFHKSLNIKEKFYVFPIDISVSQNNNKIFENKYVDLKIRNIKLFLL